MTDPQDARAATESETAEYLKTKNAERFYFGRQFNAETGKAGAKLDYGGDRHILAFGPTGSGKGVRVLLPNLLTGLKEQSAIVIDPKGEAAYETADARRAMGHEVVILNPFDVRGLGGQAFNPLAALDPASPAFYDDAAALGEALIKIEGKDPHWPQSAQGLLVALMMWEKLRRGAKADLVNVREMLTEAEESEDDGKIPTAGLRFTAGQMVIRGGDEIASLAARFIGRRDEISSIQSTADTQTRWLLSKPIRASLQGPGFDFARLREKPMTIFIVLPAERLRTHSVWLRLVIVCALNALYRNVAGRRVLLIVDEMAALGHLAPLEDAFALIRGYNIQIAAFAQDLGQLKNLYEERWETFIANAGAVFGFAPNDLTTAEWMSKRAGQTTVVAKGFSSSSGVTSGEKVSSNLGGGSSGQQMARPLFYPHELIGMTEGLGMLWFAGFEPTIRTFSPPYWRIEACRKVAKSAEREPA